MVRRSYLGLIIVIVAAILLAFQVLYSSTHGQAIAQNGFRNYCADDHMDYGSFSMVYDKDYIWGHYYDFSVPTPTGLHPGVMGYYRVSVTWIGTTSVGAFKGLPR